MIYWAQDAPRFSVSIEKPAEKPSPLCFLKGKSLPILPLSNYTYIMHEKGKVCLLDIPMMMQECEEDQPPLIDVIWTSRLVEQLE